MEYLKINAEEKDNELNKKIITDEEKDISPEAKNNSKENNKKAIEKLCLILFCFIVIILGNNKGIKNSNINNEEENINIVPNNEDIYRQERFDSRENAFNKAKKFLESNLKGILLQKPPVKSVENPIVSAIIPVYNSKDYISRAIKSIQNQNLTDLEIILVDDKSTDDTLSFIQEIQQGDPRIKIINNQKNMGILYSRCIGALYSKSKYIFPLDNDDMFLDSDVFKAITNIADKGSFDIVEFKGIRMANGHLDMLNKRKSDVYFANHPLNLVIYQPQLGNYPIWPGKTLNTYQIESGHLWGKCFRTEIYKKAINKMGEKRYTRRMIRHEDILMIYVLCNTANSYKFIGKYGLLNVYRKTSASRRSSGTEMDSYHIYLLDVAVDFVKDTFENKKILVHFVMYLLYSKSLKNTLKNDIYKNLFFKSVNKVLNMDKISNELKDEIRKKGKELKLKF